MTASWSGPMTHGPRIGDLRQLVIPPTIQALMAARLDSLGREERTVIERASVEGKVFHRGAVTELAPELIKPIVQERLATLTRMELRPPRPGRVRRRGGLPLPPPAHPRRGVPGTGQADPLRATRAVRWHGSSGLRGSGSPNTRRSLATTTSRPTATGSNLARPTITRVRSPNAQAHCWPPPPADLRSTSTSMRPLTSSSAWSSCCHPNRPTGVSRSPRPDGSCTWADERSEPSRCSRRRREVPCGEGDERAAAWASWSLIGNQELNVVHRRRRGPREAERLRDQFERHGR